MNDVEEFSVSLRIAHPNMDSDIIDKNLNLAANFKYSLGDQKRTPKGTIISGFRGKSFWFYEMPRSSDPLDKKIDALNKILIEQGDFVRGITDTGGRVEYFIGWFLAGNSGIVLGRDLLRTMSELKVELSFDVYP